MIALRNVFLQFCYFFPPLHHVIIHNITILLLATPRSGINNTR